MKRWYWRHVRSVVGGKHGGPLTTAPRTVSGPPAGRAQLVLWLALVGLLIAPLLGSSVAGAPGEGPVPGQVHAQSFEFSPLKMPFAAGEGWIVFGYGPGGNHNGGDQYALDFCQYTRGDECRQSDVDDFVLAPTDLIHVFSLTSDGANQNGPADFHLFEIAADGGTRLCMSLGHFRITFPGGLRPDRTIPQGTVLGTLVEYPASVPHIHMGLYTSTTDCGSRDGRTAVPFDVRPYLLDGTSFATNAGHNHAGIPVRSTNVPADIDGDGDLTVLDYNLLLTCLAPSSCSAADEDAADLNRDGVVDDLDYQMLMQAFDAWKVR